MWENIDQAVRFFFPVCRLKPRDPEAAADLVGTFQFPIGEKKVWRRYGQYLTFVFYLFFSPLFCVKEKKKKRKIDGLFCFSPPSKNRTKKWERKRETRKNWTLFGHAWKNELFVGFDVNRILTGKKVCGGVGVVVHQKIPTYIRTSTIQCIVHGTRFQKAYAESDDA